ncbi:hypothetical protein KKA15_00145 [Patescibacteria group bacterium]|nr:hypothetical protein [Patescibacteria group bacterium]
MSLINIGLLLIAGLNILLALLIWQRNKKNKINISFAITVAVVGVWSLTMGLFRASTDFSSAWLWTWIQFSAGVLIVIPFYFFSIYFPFQKLLLKKWHIAIIILSIAVILLVILLPGVWIKDIYFVGGEPEYLTDRWGLLYANLHVLVFIFLAFYNFLNKYLESEGFTKKQLSYVMIAMGIIAIFGPLFSTVIPFIVAAKSTHWLGPYFSLPMAVFLSYFIFKKE